MGHPILVEHLHSQDLSKRIRAAEFLRDSSSPAIIKELLGSLRKQDRRVMIRAAWGLSLMKPALIVPILAHTLVGEDLAAASEAAWALGRMNSPLARQVLVDALEHPDPFVRHQGARCLWQHAIRGFKSKKVERLLIEMLKGDNGAVAITLMRMQSTGPVPNPPQSYPTFFHREGGDRIR